MTPPVTTDALVEDGCRVIYGKNWDGPADKAPGEAMRKVWRDLVAKAQAPLLAAHQQVTAERDEDLAELARLRAEGEAKDRALKPFAECADVLHGRDDTGVCFRQATSGTTYLEPLTIGDFRAARAATAREKQE